MNIEPATIERANAIALLKTLNIQLKEIGDSHAVMAVVVGASHANYFGGAHGGLIATLADSVSFFPATAAPFRQSLHDDKSYGDLCPAGFAGGHANGTVGTGASRAAACQRYLSHYQSAGETGGA